MTRRIERDPEPWEYSESNFQHVAASLAKAEIEQQRKESSQSHWRAFWGGVIGTSVALLFWYGMIYTVLWVYGLVRK
jgi:hypothetical protein